MKARAAFLVLVWCLLLSTAAAAQSLPSAKPEEVGLSSERLGKLTARLKADIEKGVIPGAIVLVARHGKIAMFETLGMLNPEAKAPMTRDAIFRIYSMSKPITSVAAMILFEEGRLALNEPVSKYIPQLGGLKVGVEKPDPSGGAPTLELVPAQRDMTIQDLLRHTSGLTYGFTGSSLVKKMYVDAKVSGDYPSNAELVERLGKLPLAYQPGTTWEYSYATDVLGRVVEVVSDRSLFAFEKARILDPLGMKDTSFYVTDKSKQDRIVEPFPNDRSIGVDADFNDPRVAQKWESGGGGMVGTTMDYARFAQMLLNGGSLNGRRILGPKTVAFMTSDHVGTSIAPGPAYLPGPGFGFGLGFAVRKDAGVSPLAGSVGEFNWGGAGGTFFWIDPKEDMFVVFMMQSPKQRVPYRAVLKNMIYAAVTKPAAR
ncbi:MAG: serine hydrolase [Candidatus Rokuibacteriota bacterium]|nr:MAG: serine hydrolase [Candidatus Rokubacteria bacterium]